MSIKTRFKKALFSFFKDEILEYVGSKVPVQKIEFISKEMKFIEIKQEIVLEDNHLSMEPVNIMWAKQIDRIKRELFEVCMQHIKVDTFTIIDPTIHPYKKIKLSLFVGTPK